MLFRSVRHNFAIPIISSNPLISQDTFGSPPRRQPFLNRAVPSPYTDPLFARHAPSSVTPTSGGAQALSYDGNGNMVTGLSGKVMSSMINLLRKPTKRTSPRSMI